MWIGPGCSLQGCRVMGVAVAPGRGRGVPPRKRQARIVNKCHGLEALCLGHRWLLQWKFGPFQPPPLPLRGSGTHSNAQNLLEGTSKVSLHSTTSQTPSCGFCTCGSSHRALTLRAAWRRGGTLERGPGLDCGVTSVSAAWKENQGSRACPSGLLHAASLPPPVSLLTCSNTESPSRSPPRTRGAWTRTLCTSGKEDVPPLSAAPPRVREHLPAQGRCHGDRMRGPTHL